MKSIFTRIGLISGLAAILTASVFAQTATPQSGTQGEGRRGGREGRMGRMGRPGARGEGGRPGRGMGRALHRLNLSDAQRTQLREIEARYGQSFKTQHQELRQLMEVRRAGGTLTPEQEQRAQQLRTEVRAGGDKMHAEILALLTPEQRDQLKRMREEGEARRKERREGLGRPNDNQ